jgi:5'-3' exonuclease
MKMPTDFRVVRPTKEVAKPQKRQTQFISGKTFEKVTTIEVAHDKSGNITETRYVCKHKRGDKDVYEVLLQRGELYSVDNPLPRKREFAIVNRACYNHYVKYLKTKDILCYEKAVRAYRRAG